MIQNTFLLNTPKLNKFINEVLPKHRDYFLGQNKDANELDFLESLNEIYSIDLSDYIRIRGKNDFDNEIYRNKRIIEYLRKKIIELRTDQSVENKALTGQLLDNEQKFDLNKKILNVKEAAVYLSISESYLYKLTSRNAIMFSKPNNKKIYFEKAYLEEWMMSGKRKSKEDIEREALSYCTLSK